MRYKNPTFYAILMPKVEKYVLTRMETVMPDREKDSEYAIKVADVTKVYRLYEKPIDRLKESMSISHKNYHRDFYALNQLSFRVRKGETVGIIEIGRASCRERVSSSV